MTMSRDLFLAILSMDSYNRDYGFGVRVSGSTIGNARILSRDSLQITQQQYQTWQAADFYALAYDLTGMANGGAFADGETVIGITVTGALTPN